MDNTVIPNAPGSALDASRPEARRYNVQRSCIRCHRRKIRCDKTVPCSTCVKSGTAGSCTYPGPERIKRRMRKKTSTTLVLDHASIPVTEGQDGDIKARSSTFTGLLIKDGNLVRYVNDHVLSQILQKEEEIRSAIASPYIPSSTGSPRMHPRLFSLLHPMDRTWSVQDPDKLLPERRRAVHLWQVFVLNVDPIIKVLHIPTARSVVYTAIYESEPITPDLHALLFAIYFSALNSILHDAGTCSEGDQYPALEQFKSGLEMSLSQGDFLDRPTMFSLQAMTIFIGAFRTFGSGRSIWTMNGTLIRVAQLMGIHRDGKIFNLSPFDQEMRRRLWWKIITFDSRPLEDQGVWIASTHSLGDARIPLNIDDRDIHPDTEDMPEERTGFTELTPLVSMCHIHLTGEAAARLALCADLESYSKQLSSTLKVIAETKDLLNNKFYLDHDPHIPMQRLFNNGTRAILDKAEWRCEAGLFRHQQLSNPSDLNRDGKARAENDKLFTRACEILRANRELFTNEIYTSLMWYSSSYLPLELLTFVLWRLYMTPSETLSDFGWDVVTEIFSAIEGGSTTSERGPRWAILCKLKDKVANIRMMAGEGDECPSSPRVQEWSPLMSPSFDDWPLWPLDPGTS